MLVSLPVGAIDVWDIPVDAPPKGATAQSLALTAGGWERLPWKARAEKGRQRIVSLARRIAILSHYAEATMWEQKQAISVDGREPPPATERVLRFSVSHSGDCMLLAVTCDGRVGIDIERLRQGVRADNLARRFFTEREGEGFFSLAPDAREKAVFRTWVRKEAYLKAVGGGVPASLRRFSVSVALSEPPAILDTELENGGASAFSLYDIDVPEGYVGALAAEGTGHRIRYLDDKGHGARGCGEVGSEMEPSM
jgi:phosphopantetheinyl transferase